MRQARDLTMAILILGVAAILLFADQLNIPLRVGKTFRLVLGVLFVLYGSFRLYRGLKRDF